MSGSTQDDLKPSFSSMKSLNIFLQEAPEDFSPYRARTRHRTFPFRTPPHYMPPSNHMFSLQCAFRYSLPMSHAKTPKSFNAATRKAILTLSQDTTLE